MLPLQHVAIAQTLIEGFHTGRRRRSRARPKNPDLTQSIEQLGSSRPRQRGGSEPANELASPHLHSNERT
jgi:hypothetical protein